MKNVDQSKKQTCLIFFVSEIKIASENDFLYENFAIANADDWELVQSIRELGIQEPLILSTDGYLLSGHRRYAAARFLGLKKVPVRHTDILFGSLTIPDKLKLLKTYNQQREKTPGEKIREQLLEINPEDAYSSLLRRRLKNSRDIKLKNVELGDIKKRSRITTKNFLRAVQHVISENEEYWPITVRRIHYLLLNNPPLKHDKKPNSCYQNDRNSYQALTNLLIRARLSNLVPVNAIEDTTRPIQLGGGFSTFQQFIQQESEYFLSGYSRNLMQGQHQHIEIMLEKNALRLIIEKVARQYCIPVTTGRGFSSFSPRAALYERFRCSGHKKLILLMLTDFDPDGEQIAASFARSMRDDFGLQNISALKVALTAEDVTENDLPSDLDAKPSSPNYKKFVDKYGYKAVELDAAPVKLLQDKLHAAIENVIDIEAFNDQVELEKEDSRIVEAYRREVLQLIGSAKYYG